MGIHFHGLYGVILSLLRSTQEGPRLGGVSPGPGLFCDIYTSTTISDHQKVQGFRNDLTSNYPLCLPESIWSPLVYLGAWTYIPLLSADSLPPTPFILAVPIA
uniref:Uncharacterized protein n=1 Tax=Sphaerodactylus townsendi TaxID=933632 RepID=A0ACB8EQZ6_9SAUR